MTSSTDTFLGLISSAVEKNELVKITLGGKRNKQDDLKNVYVKPVILKAGPRLSFVYRYNTRDITANHNSTEAIAVISKLLKEDFYNGDLFTTVNDFQLLQSPGKTRIITKPSSLSGAPTHEHDKKKKRIIQASGNVYLQKLGITTSGDVVKKEMQDKYKQINRYVEIIDGIIKERELKSPLHVVDMGSGKGYLTFALYDYLSGTMNQPPDITGIEMRNDLVNTCNAIATAAGFTHLHFEKGTIADTMLPSVDMLIALHACDTATDDAVYKGIKAGAEVIIVAPCCHKQIRKQMRPANILETITKHGILLERQAEMVTDTIRSLLMEAMGYKTRIFEFINTEHTPKNVMIVGIKKENVQVPQKEYLEKVKSLKAMFNIEQHYLEKLLQV